MCLNKDETLAVTKLQQSFLKSQRKNSMRQFLIQNSFFFVNVFHVTNWIGGNPKIDIINN